MSPMLFSSKRGDIELALYYPIWIVLFVMIALSLTAYAYRVTSDTRFERIKGAADLALTADAATIPSTNYAITLQEQAYRRRLSNGYAYASITDVPKKGSEPTIIEERQAYIIDLLMQLVGDEQPSNQQLEITKNGNSLLFVKKKDTAQIKPACTQPDISQYPVVIDPGHGGITDTGDPGEQAQTTAGRIIESDITTKIAQFMLAELRSSALKQAVMTRPDNSAIDPKTRIGRIPHNSVLVSIHVHRSKAAGKTSVTLHIRKDQTPAQAIACVVISSLLDVPGFTGGNIVFEEIDDKVDDNSQAAVLGRPAVGIIVELNGIDLPNTPILNEPAVGRAIARALTMEG